MSTTEFDILFDKVCDDSFPKIKGLINQLNANKAHLSHLVISFLTDEEGYNSDMAVRIWDSYQYMNRINAPQKK